MKKSLFLSIALISILCVPQKANQDLRKTGDIVAPPPDPVEIVVQLNGPRLPISDLLHGYNHVWIKGGNGVWDLKKQTTNRPVIAALRPLKPSLLRFPGGTLAHRYRWEQGIGPFKKRPQGRALAHMNEYSNAYGTLEFLEVCKQLGDVAPVIVTNWDEGSPEEAAAWLAFLNGSTENTFAIGSDPAGKDWKTVGYWAKRRQECGRPEPINVQHFEIGNELYWKRFSETADSYTEKFIAYSRLLKKVDPTVQVGGVGFHKPKGPGYLDSTQETGMPWNPTVIKKAGADLDFLTVHVYRGLDRTKNLLLEADEVEEEVAEIRKIADEIRGPNLPRLKIGITEYNSMITHNKIGRFSPDMVNLESALYNASLLMGFARQGVEIGSFHILCLYPPEDPNLAGGIYFAALGIHENRLIMSPTYHVLSMLSESLRGSLLEVEAGEAMLDDPKGIAHKTLDIVASAPDEDTVKAVIVNRSHRQEMPVRLRIEGGSVDQLIEVTTLTSESIKDSNEGTFSEVSPTQSYALLGDDGTLSLQLPRTSLSIVSFKRTRN